MAVGGAVLRCRWIDSMPISAKQVEGLNRQVSDLALPGHADVGIWN